MPANIDRLPFNVIDRCPELEVVTFEPEPFAFIPARTLARNTAWLATGLAGVVGAVVLSRWAWHQPTQAVTALVILACVAWGVERAVSE